MTKSLLNKRCLAFCLGLMSATYSHAQEPPLNVLMIIVDDLAPVVSAYGGPVQTPAIDQLAARGVRFTNNFANVPVCGASRASMLSSLAPTSTRFLSFDSRLDQDVPDAVSLPAYFRSNGWHTVANGKVFDVIADSQDSSWSEPVWSPADQWHGQAPDARGEHLQGAYLEAIPSGRAPYFERLEAADSDYPDGQVANKTVDDLRRLATEDQPFFVVAGFRKPHLPFNAPARYWRPGLAAKDALPPSWFAPVPDLPQARHRSPELRSQYDALPLFGDPTDTRAAELVNAYHAAVRYVDALVGQVLAGLEDSGAADRTVVVLLGDHGFLLGDQRLWTKHALFESSLRTPLILAAPKIEGGTEVRAITDLLDVYPTLVALAGLDRPEQLAGVSLQPLLADVALAVHPDKPASVSRWMNGESVRFDRYRYSRFFDETDATVGDMLFDLSQDPHEQVNLASEPSSATVVRRARQLLVQDRIGETWSPALDKNVSRWSLVSSPTGALLLAGLAYPVQSALGVLAGFVGLGFLVYRWRRSRRSFVDR